MHMPLLQYVNEKYIPQLREVLQWPQSIGIVGGRPSSSLYFIGCQDNNVLYLDPHEVQDVSMQPVYMLYASYVLQQHGSLLQLWLHKQHVAVADGDAI